MKTVEEKIAAWVDGKLTGNQIAELDRELGGSHWRTGSESGLDRSRLIVETEADRQMGDLLRAHCGAVALDNADFFNHQLLQRIEADQAASRKGGERSPGWSLFLSLRRMTLAGAFCLAMAALLFASTIPGSRRSNPTARQFMAEITNARTEDPSITASTFHSKSEKVTVLWLDGLKYLPDGEQL
jgi:hypothetical protein